MTLTHLSLRLALPLLLVSVAESGHAQVQASAPSTIDVVRGGFEEVAGWIVKAAEAVPEAQYSYRPTSTVRTLGQLLGHIADGNNYYCPRAGGTQVQWTDAIANSGAGKAELITKLKASIAQCTAAHTALNAARSAPLLANYGHVNLHYGNLVTYLRMLGMTPPSS